ncbi:photosystem reaction center subunit H [Nocardioides sp. Soil777]|uniref:DUF2382 domain-containing protein n=1 Tax=Nocardioides sp. Soil777 TaxID=1736409 RepID=UPI000702C1E2|nr:PRC and DUF2382 domain-containing protein [Nocardioides sp. Soil777]KRF04418.1 photosystem reaction center subunit H [Nocardioides sp. Soil777]
MLSNDQAQQLLTGGGNVVDNNGDKIGSIGQVFLDDRSGRPEWVTVKTGLFGGGESFVPLRDAEVAGDDVRVPYSKDMVKDAPRISDADGHLSEDEEETLYRYYGTEGADYDTSYGDPATGYTETRDGAGHDTSGPDTDSAMTRSEEQVRVGTETRETGRVRLRKYVVTENVTQTVPVSHEEVRLEREPITDANRDEALSGGDITEEEHEVVLSEERPVVQKETVPVERVRLDKDTVTEQHQVDETVRKEEIEFDDATRTRTDGTRDV